jgi:hypothetical protein
LSDFHLEGMFQRKILKPVSLATQEAEIREISVQG